MIDKARIQAEADAFFEWPGADKSTLTTTSALIFCSVIAEMVRKEASERIAELEAKLAQFETDDLTVAYMGGFEKGRDDAKLAQPAEPVQGWIACADRLPKAFEDVMVWPNPSHMCMTAQVDKGGKWEYQEYETNYGWVDHKMQPPTHWQPLPEAPTQGTTE